MSHQLPTILGPLEPTEGGLTLHSADARRYDPQAFWSKPEAQPTGTADPLPLAPVLPITLLPDTKFIPLNYVVHMSSQRCLHCGTTHESSVVYAYNSIEPRFNLGKPVSHLVPVDRFSYNVPVKVQRLKETTTPACHECAREPMDLSHLPKPAAADAYKRLLNPTLAQPTVKKANGSTAPKGKAPKTIGDLLNF